MTVGGRRGRFGGEQRRGMDTVVTSIGAARSCRVGVAAETGAAWSAHQHLRQLRSGAPAFVDADWPAFSDRSWTFTPREHGRYHGFQSTTEGTYWDRSQKPAAGGDRDRCGHGLSPWRRAARTPRTSSPNCGRSPTRPSPSGSVPPESCCAGVTPSSSAARTHAMPCGWTAKPPVVTASAALKKRRSSYTVVRHVLRARDGRFPHPNVRPHHFVPAAVRNDVKTRSRLRSRGPGPESQSRSEGASGGDTGCLHRRQGRPAGPAASGVCTLRSPGTTRGRL